MEPSNRQPMGPVSHRDLGSLSITDLWRNIASRRGISRYGYIPPTPKWDCSLERALESTLELIRMMAQVSRIFYYISLRLLEEYPLTLLLLLLTANTNPAHPRPPANIFIPDFSRNMGFGGGLSRNDATIYLAVFEEYATGRVSNKPENSLIFLILILSNVELWIENCLHEQLSHL